MMFHFPGREFTSFHHANKTFGDVGTAAAGAASAGAQIASAEIAANAQNKARKEEIRTAQEVAPTITESANVANSYLNPYVQTGNNANSMLSNGLTQDFLESTPGYKFALNQGLQAATNSAAARGLGDSGAALKGASTFATGLADNTYQNQFNDTNALAERGFVGAQQQGNNKVLTANNAAQTRMEGANNAMTATVGAGNALASGINSVGNTASNYAMYQKLLGNSGSSANSEDDPFAGSGTSAW